jgi:hypothetical protein
VKGQLQEAEQKAPDEGAYDSYNQIDYQTGSSSSYNLFGQETGDKSYYQEPNQGLNCHVDSHVFLLRQLLQSDSPMLLQDVLPATPFKSFSHSPIQCLYLAGQLIDFSDEDARIAMSPPSPLFTELTLQLLQISCKSIPIHRITPRYKY